MRWWASVVAAVLLSSPAFGGRLRVLDLPRPSVSRPSTTSLAAGTLPDPFRWRVPLHRGGAKVDLHLQGIIWSRKRPLAVVNSKLVGVGDMVGGAMVLSISKEGVVLTMADGSTKVLKFKKRIIQLFQ